MTTNAYKNTLHVYTPNDKDFVRIRVHPKQPQRDRQK